MDGKLGYNYLFIIEDDVSKIAFKCLRSLGMYEWVPMSFDLKNVGATYKKAINPIFHDMIS